MVLMLGDIVVTKNGWKVYAVEMMMIWVRSKWLERR